MRRFLRGRAQVLYNWFLEFPAPNDQGVRAVEYSFIAAQMPEGEPDARALDFGCGLGWLGLLAARRGFRVTALDMQQIQHPYTHPNYFFVQHDILQGPLPASLFSLVLNISSIEHVGLARYGGRASPGASDLKAMQLLREMTKVGGIMLLTTSIGQDLLVPGAHRVYGRERLARLLAGWTVELAEWWAKDPRNRWVETEQEKAFRVVGNDHYYALGLFRLRRSL